jgi:hypothetical protein
MCNFVVLLTICVGGPVGVRNEVVVETEFVDEKERGSVRIGGAVDQALLRLRARVQSLLEIITAPKLVYRIEHVYVYRNGVFADYSVSNPNPRRKYVAPMFLDAPVRNMRAADADGHRWRVPVFSGDVSYRNPDTFVAIEASGSVRFRSRVSFLVDKPLEIVSRTPEQVVRRPTELSYGIIGWSHAYTALTDFNQVRESIYTIGSGKVPVKWIESDYPREWKLQSRLFDKE